MQIRLVLPLAASLLLPTSSLLAAVHPHHRASAHPIVSRSANTHFTHPLHVTDRGLASGMSTERATEIQTALIQHGYLSGDPTGSWDAASVAAMQKVQADNGWQTKFVPDSRALIKLGLGANTTPSPTPPAAAPSITASTSVQPALQ